MNNSKWVSICGEDFVIWSQKQHDFGICFQNLFLHIPILAVFGVSSAYFFGLHTSTIPRSKVQRFALVIRSIISIMLTFSPIIEICYNIYLNEETMDNASVLLGVVQGEYNFPQFSLQMIQNYVFRNICESYLTIFFVFGKKLNGISIV